MREKALISIFFLLLLICLTACGVNTRGPLPYGKWESIEPYIFMDINPNDKYFYGTYQQNDEIIEVWITFQAYWKQFDIYKVSDTSKINEPDFYELALLNGFYRIKNGKIYYRIKPHWQEKSGVKHTIVFELIEEYEVPDKENE